MNEPYYQKDFKYTGFSFEEAVGDAEPLNDAVGRIAMNFGALEEALSSSIIYLLGTDTQKGLTITSEMSFKSKLHVMASLIKQEYEKKPLSFPESDFQDLIKMCSKSEELRNKLLHSSWVYDHSKKTSEIRRRKVSAKIKHGYKKDEEPLTPGQVLDIADYIIYTSESVYEFFLACFDGYEKALEDVIYA